jgi:hypothetical protein
MARTTEMGSTMLLLGRVLFVVGFAGLALQIAESWLGFTGLPIDNTHMTNAMLWWAVCGGMSAGGVWLMKRYAPDDAR